MVIFFLLPKWDGQLFTCSFLKCKAEVYDAQISGLFTQIVKKICFQPNISFRAKGEEFDFTFPACLHACKSKVYRFPLKHNAESRKKQRLEYHSWLSSKFTYKRQLKRRFCSTNLRKLIDFLWMNFPDAPSLWKHPKDGDIFAFSDSLVHKNHYKRDLYEFV